MPNLLLITIGKAISRISVVLNRGNGSTWPGHIALKGNKKFINRILLDSPTKVIIVAGTNGKTTTSGLIRKGLETTGKNIIQNASGANLLNGVASTLLLNTNTKGKLTQDYVIFEVDENALPLVLNQISPDYLVLLNLFRDQLDRYGEINIIAEKWHDAIIKLPKKTKLILNADDPQIAYLGLQSNLKSRYFSLEDSKIKSTLDEAADSVFCPKCGNKLSFVRMTFSHLGKWYCNKCGLRHPKPELTSYHIYPLTGTYNKYNTIAAALVLKESGITNKQIENAFKEFIPAFGRQEIIKYQGRNVQLFLSKNPTSFNQSYATINELKGKTILLVLNDRIPDGRDVSWIWDTNLTKLKNFTHILITGDRVYDMALRFKYELGIKEYQKKTKVFEDLKEAVTNAINAVKQGETLYVLPTYSAMLEIRKILTGKKIL